MREIVRHVGKKTKNKLLTIAIRKTGIFRIGVQKIGAYLYEKLCTGR